MSFVVILLCIQITWGFFVLYPIGIFLPFNLSLMWSVIVLFTEYIFKLIQVGYMALLTSISYRQLVKM